MKKLIFILFLLTFSFGVLATPVFAAPAKKAPVTKQAVKKPVLKVVQKKVTSKVSVVVKGQKVVTNFTPIASRATIICTGPDGKQFKATQKDCEAIRAFWAKANPPKSNPQPSSSGGSSNNGGGSNSSSSSSSNSSSSQNNSRPAPAPVVTAAPTQVAPTASPTKTPTPTFSFNDVSLDKTDIAVTLNRSQTTGGIVYGLGIVFKSDKLIDQFKLVANVASDSAQVGFYETTGGMYPGFYNNIRTFISANKPNGIYKGSAQLHVKFQGTWYAGPTIFYTITLTGGTPTPTPTATPTPAVNPKTVLYTPWQTTVYPDTNFDNRIQITGENFFSLTGSFPAYVTFDLKRISDGRTERIGTNKTFIESGIQGALVFFPNGFPSGMWEISLKGSNVVTIHVITPTINSVVIPNCSSSSCTGWLTTIIVNGVDLPTGSRMEVVSSGNVKSGQYVGGTDGTKIITDFYNLPGCKTYDVRVFYPDGRSITKYATFSISCG